MLAPDARFDRAKAACVFGPTRYSILVPIIHALRLQRIECASEGRGRYPAGAQGPPARERTLPPPTGFVQRRMIRVRGGVRRPVSAAGGSGGLARFSQRLIEIYRGADEGEVCECLREVAQRLARRAELLGVEAESTRVTQYLLEHEPGLV